MDNNKVALITRDGGINEVHQTADLTAAWSKDTLVATFPRLRDGWSARCAEMVCKSLGLKHYVYIDIREGITVTLVQV